MNDHQAISALRTGTRIELGANLTHEQGMTRAQMHVQHFAAFRDTLATVEAACGFHARLRRRPRNGRVHLAAGAVDDSLT
ncbi:hypothetical protein [Rhodococcus rhodochrous]|uniref:hypothetical protein n=1 Tax=Rhodococcus rhodochrous TaxID=1829 RepID=UPI00135207C3|nr:hypothetical protein [Rhodococcus rhodochrous]